MKVFHLTESAVPYVAQLMCTIKPDWWDYHGAAQQLSDIHKMIKTIGWYLGDDEQHPKGWILCRELVDYNTLEIECSGFDDNGIFKLEHKLGTLLDTAVEYAKSKKYLTLRNGISSFGFNIHGEKLENIPLAMQHLNCDRIDYHWMLAYGFRVIGIQPNVYGKGVHLIMLAKEL